MKYKERKPLVSVVIVNYNGKRFLAGIFDSLRKCTYPNLEILMVDNCSEDDSRQFVEQHYPEVKILCNSENYMYAQGNNEGLKIVSGEYICLLNNDVEVDAGFIEPILQVFQSDPDIGAVQPKILSLEKRDYFEYAGACGGFIDRFGYPFLRGRIFFDTEKDQGQYDNPSELFWASGACFFVRRKVFDEVGYLDEDFVLHQEEIDLCWRMRLAGWKIFAVPQSKIWHYGGGTLPQYNPRKTYWNFRNNIFLLIKHFSLMNLFICLAVRIILDFIAILNELVKGHWSAAIAICKAYGWLIAHLPLLIRKRANTQKKRKISDREIFNCVYRGSIVLEYFLLNHKKMSDLMNIDLLLDYCYKSYNNANYCEKNA